MIARLWHGWARPDTADAYERLLRSEVLPGIHRIDGHRGAYLLRREREGRVEFVTITLFEDLDAVRAFAGEDNEAAVVPPAARALLDEFDERSAHFEVMIRPDAGDGAPPRM
ncbi:MAG: antibiotic biosynthesis monooxygenase family protein [Thermoleophilaceae bacterium]